MRYVGSKRAWSSWLRNSLLMASPWDSSTNGQIWYVLPGACYHMPAGSCRGIYSQPHGRCKPLCHAKWVTIMPKDIQLARHIHGEHLHYWNPPQKSVSEFLLVVGCVGFLTSTGAGKLEWDTLLNDAGFCFFFSYVNSLLFFCPAQVSWSMVFLVLHFSAQPSWVGAMCLSSNLCFFLGLAKLSQCNDFYYLD